MIQKFIKNLTLSENGLETLKINYEWADFDLTDILMHNSFNKDKIQNYKIWINNLIVPKPLSEIDSIGDDSLWYITPFIKEDCN